MSIEALQAVFRIPGEKLNGSCRMVLAVLAFHHNRESGKLCPSQHTIARESGISRMHLTRVLHELVESGLLNIESGKVSGQVNRYNLLLGLDTLSKEQGGATRMLQGGATRMLQGVQHGCYTELKRTKDKKESIRVRDAHTDSASRNFLTPISGGKKERPTPLPPSRRNLSDAEFIAELKGNVAYRHIDIDRELGKMDAWLSLPKNSSRKKTRQFVVNWLNRIEPPMAPSAQPAGVRRIPL